MYCSFCGLDIKEKSHVHIDDAHPHRFYHKSPCWSYVEKIRKGERQSQFSFKSHKVRT